MSGSTSQTPYLVATNPKATFNALLSVGDTVGGGATPWKMAGIPDGLGAFDNGDGTMTVLMNHELGATAGIVHDHGSKGAFVSKLTVNKTTLEVTAADDLIQKVFLYNSTTGQYDQSATAFARFCSADLPSVSAFYDANSGFGTQDRIFMNGEETGPEGRAFAHVVTGAQAGSSFELPRLGKFSSENSVANAFSGKKTVVVGSDDATPGEVYVYVGDKQATGTAIEKAGLTNGKLYGIQASFGDDTAATPASGTFKMVEQGTGGNVANVTGVQLNAAAASLTQFGRPEDSCWDPSNPNRLYIATTGTPTTATAAGIPTRLFAIDFTDVERPELGGRISVLLEGGVAGSNPAAGPVMIDNITVTESGLVVLQEDPGNNARLAKVWMYDPKADNGVEAFSGLTELAQHDPARFTNPAGATATPAPFSTTGFGQDEESSGAVEITSLLGADTMTFLLDTQAHYATTGELVEGGQLMTMSVAAPNAGVTIFKGTSKLDIFDGGFGNDILKGGKSADRLLGNYGNDKIDGGSGEDVLNGDAGDDEILGGSGYDVVDGGVGNDALDGGGGIDQLDGGVGDDVLLGGSGDDALKGNFGNDKLYGGSGFDQLFGNQGNDLLDGGKGNDKVDGGGGDDAIYVGMGNDTIVFGKFSDSDAVYGFDANVKGGQDLIDLTSLKLTAANFAASVSITAASDGTLVSLSASDKLLLKGVVSGAVTIEDFLI